MTSFSNISKVYDARAITAASYIADDHVVVVETDTILGFSCRLSKLAIDRLIRIKSRPKGKPFVVIVSDIAQVLPYLDMTVISSEDLDVLCAHYERPTTFVVPITPYGVGINRVSIDSTIAIRIVRAGILSDICKLTNAPVVSSSVNVSTCPPILCAKEASVVFQEAKYVPVYPQISSISSRPSRIIDLATGRTIRD